MSSPAVHRSPYSLEEDKGFGWVLFAGTMLAILGILNFIYGIAAIGNSAFFAADAKFVLTGLDVWGWVLLLLGIVQLLASGGILAQTPRARWVGILSAAGNSVTQLLVLPASPLLAVSLFAVDVLVIYGLIAYGAARRTA